MVYSKHLSRRLSIFCLCSSHSITADLTPQDMALAAEYFMVDGVIITGKMTGSAADPQVSDSAGDVSGSSLTPFLLQESSGKRREMLDRGFWNIEAARVWSPRTDSP